MSDDELKYTLPKETSTQEFIGYRAWMNRLLLEKVEVEGDGPGFKIGYDVMSLFYPTVWDGPVLVCDKKPEANNRHGIYACKDETDILSEGHTFYGKIGLSGTVIEHEKGYRGTKAVIRELWFNQLAVVGVTLQMLETPGLAKNLPHWEEVYRWIASPRGVADYIEGKYQCECHVSAPYDQKEIDSDVRKIQDAAAKTG